MLKDFSVTTQIAVTDLTRAKAFYEEKLGLEPMDIPAQGVVVYECGQGTNFLVYERASAPHAENTVMNFNVTDIKQVVDDLKAKGVSFEEYDMGDIKTENGIATRADWKGAWFKDPDENIIGLIEM